MAGSWNKELRGHTPYPLTWIDEHVGRLRFKVLMTTASDLDGFTFQE